MKLINTIIEYWFISERQLIGSLYSHDGKYPIRPKITDELTKLKRAIRRGWIPAIRANPQLRDQRESAKEVSHRFVSRH